MIGVAALAAAARQPRESVSCQSNIVSSTVVATFCGHRQADEEVLDLLILWRGTPGWFQRGPGGGGGGSRTFGAGTNGEVSQYQTYGDVRIAFAANFDTKVVTIGRSTVQLAHINTVMIDDVDGNWRSPATQWTEPRLPLAGDWNVVLVRRSSALLRYLRCDVPMPQAPVSYPGPRLPVVTVCEKLNVK
jgi:hypothetical protein